MTDTHKERALFYFTDEDVKFSLVARDPTAPALVGLWIAIRSGNVVKATHFFSQLLSLATTRYANDPTDQAQLDSAKAVLAEMESRHKDNET